MARIIANGEEIEVQVLGTVSEFLSGNGLKPTQVVVELNGNVIPREMVSVTKIQDGDRVEVIVPVAGG